MDNIVTARGRSHSGEDKNGFIYSMKLLTTLWFRWFSSLSSSLLFGASPSLTGIFLLKTKSLLFENILCILDQYRTISPPYFDSPREVPWDNIFILPCTHPCWLKSRDYLKINIKGSDNKNTPSTSQSSLFQSKQFLSRSSLLLLALSFFQRENIPILNILYSYTIHKHCWG